MTAAALPAMGQERTRKTELLDVDGKSVDRLQLRYDFDAGWVIDNQNLLYRDVNRDHYLVTLKEPCTQIDVRSRSFRFFPSWSWQLLATNDYEVKPEAGEECDIARIEQVDDAKAATLRNSAQRRIWR
jgi:hypothetical protein